MAVLDYSTVVGKDLLESLIIRLYSDPRTIFREYVQNACDSIYDAIKSGVLSSLDEGHVVIDINAAKKCIQVQDNGTGIPKNMALAALMDIFHSGKDGIGYAGQYGIGRLAGGGYCKELIFRTTSKGENVETQLTVDIQLLKKILNDSTDDRSAEQVMQHICNVTYPSAHEEDHYMIVCLKDVTNSTDILLDEDGITEYIRDIAPIDYQVPFKQLINNNLPQEYQERYEDIRHIHVTINNNNDLKKRYGLNIEGTGDEIKKLRFFTLSSANYGSLAWGWYAVTPFTVQIPSSDRNAGIRLRKLNISLDKELLNGYFREERGNQYFYGEIFIDNDNIKPNSGRQGLSSGDESEALIASLKDYFKELYKVYSKANTIKNKLKAIKTRYSDYISKKSSLNQSESDIFLNYLRGDVQTFKEAVENPRYSDEVKDICEIYTLMYEEELAEKIQELYAPKPNPQSIPVVTTTTSNTPNTKSQNKPQNSQPTIQPQPNTAKTVERPSGNAKPQPSIFVPEQTTNSSVKKDAFQRLQDAGYSANDVAMTRKIFGYMNILCPPANKTLMEQLKEKTIDLLITNRI